MALDANLPLAFDTVERAGHALVLLHVVGHGVWQATVLGGGRVGFGYDQKPSRAIFTAHNEVVRGREPMLEDML